MNVDTIRRNVFVTVGLHVSIAYNKVKLHVSSQFTSTYQCKLFQAQLKPVFGGGSLV